MDLRPLDEDAAIERVLSALQILGPGRFLHVLCESEPICFYGVMGNLGYSHEWARRGDGDVEVFLWSAQDATAELALRRSRAG